MFEPLSDRDLETLAGALSAGQLVHGVTKAGLFEVLGTVPEESLTGLLALSSEGWNPNQLEKLCRHVLEARRSKQRLSHVLDIAISGPSAEGVPMRDTGTVFRELVQEAQREVILASYAIHNGRELLAPLAEKMDSNPNFKATMYLDIQRRNAGDSRTPEQRVAQYRHDFVEKWPGKRLPELFYFTKSQEADWRQRASMHAKIVAIDRQKMLVTSANLTRAAQVKNIEVGVIIDNTREVNRVVDYLDALRQQQVFQGF